MAYLIYHRYGACETNPSLESLPGLYDELADFDDEHPSVSLGHESEWSLSAYAFDGLLIWENVESDDGARHMIGVPKAKVIELWTLLAAGDIAAIEAEPWQDGNG